MREKAEKRHKDYAKAIRKRRIDRELNPEKDTYNNLHQYSKNKISSRTKDNKIRKQREKEKLDSEENEKDNICQ